MIHFKPSVLCMMQTSKLRIRKDRARSMITLAKSVTYRELLEGIRKNGFINALTVTPNGYVVDGVYRYYVALELGISEVPVQVVQ